MCGCGREPDGGEMGSKSCICAVYLHTAHGRSTLIRIRIYLTGLIRDTRAHKNSTPLGIHTRRRASAFKNGKQKQPQRRAQT